MSHFRHEPLISPHEQIRLIQLLPRQPGHYDSGPSREDGTELQLVSPATPEAHTIELVPVKCTIQHVLLHDEQNLPSFTAMSYTWGKPARNHRIMINGLSFLVTESLEVMLRHMQSTTDTLTLWIDQLCIDQTNTNEKSVQVPLMKDIYTAAIQTIVWLGPAEKDSDAIMDFLADVGKEGYEFGLMEIKLAEFQNWSEESGKDDRLRKIKNDLDALLKRIGATFPLGPFASLIARPWFYRVWVMQEVALGRDVVFNCGEKSISYDHLRAAVVFHIFYNWNIMKDLQLLNPMEVMRNFSILMDLNAIDVAPITHMLSARKKYQAQAAGQGDSLYNLLRNYVGVTDAIRLEATDPRDMVFGLLGLANDVKQLGIETSYNKTCVEVYTDVARRLIENGHVDILALSQDPKSLPPSQGGHLPSWVPDWSGTIQQQCVEAPEKGAPFSACGTTRVSVIKNDTLSNILGTLRLEGIRVDEVEMVGTVLALPANVDQKKLNLERYDFLKEIDNFCQESARRIGGIYTDPHLREEAVWRVPIGDRGWDRELNSGGYPFTGRATAKCRQGYEAIGKFFAKVEHLGGLGEERMLSMVDREGAGSRHLEVSRLPTSAATDESNMTEPFDTIGTMSEDAISYMAMIDDQKSRRPFLSDKGYVGLGPSHLVSGDIICILFGAKVPYILRRRDTGFVLVGEAYCYGIMDGELMEQDPAPESFMLL